MTIPLTLILVVLLSASQTLDAAAAAAALTSSFAFPTFATAAPDLALSGGAEIPGDTVVLSPTSGVTYANPVRFVGNNPGFSTDFGFILAGAATIVFSLAPNATDSPVLSVAYVATAGSIDMVIGGEVSVRSSNVSVSYGSGKLRCWIDYDGELKSVEVRLSEFDDLRPANYTVSYTVDLSSVLWREAMVVSISSRSGYSTVYSWDFAAHHGAPYLMHSEPLDPYREPRERAPVRMRRVRPWRILLAVLFAVACGLLLAFAALLVLSVVFGGRRPVAPVEYPEHAIECRNEKIVLVGEKGVDSNTK